MAANKVLGLIFPNMHDDNIASMTALRSLGSLPFGARYRLIDFPLSNLINSDIGSVGVIARKNYQSLMEHIGAGKDWDLARKRGGLTVLPPYGHSGFGMYSSRIQAIYSVLDYIEAQHANTVVLTDCDCVCSVDLRAAIEEHDARGADCTILCTESGDRSLPADALYLEADAHGRVTALRTAPIGEAAKLCCMNIYIFRKDVLTDAVRDLATRGMAEPSVEFLQSSLGRLDVYCHRFDGYTGFLSDAVAYYNVSMDLLRPAVRHELFSAERPVHTRVRDEAPVIYGLGSVIRNSIVADGCYIDGEVENSIIFRGVHIAKGCRVRNSVIMRGVNVGENSTIQYAILDKNVTVDKNKSLQGLETYPIYVNKGAAL